MCLLIPGCIYVLLGRCITAEIVCFRLPDITAIEMKKKYLAISDEQLESQDGYS